MPTSRASRVERLLPPLAAVAVVLAGAVWANARVGYPEASGIVEESIGGPLVAGIVAAIAGAPVALGGGLFDGLVGAVRSTAVRRTVRTVAYLVLGAWCALTVALVVEIDCDGTCAGADDSVTRGAALAGVALVVVAVGVARGVDLIRSVVSSTRDERSGREATA